MLRIETAGLHDLAGVYRTCLRSGDAGKDATAMYRDPDLLGHVYAGSYIAHGRGTQLVVVDDEGVAGYLLSTDDTLAFEAWCAAEWWPPLQARYPRLDDDSADANMIRHIHEPERTPDELAQEFPAHLHIDLDERARGSGLGRVLIERLIAELRERGVVGLHLGVDIENPNAIGFYEHLGFREVDRERWGLLMGIHLDR